MKSMKVNDTILKLINKFTAKDNLRPAMQSIYYHEGCLIATDGYILIQFEAEYDSNLEGKLIRYNSKFESTETQDNFPSYKDVMPDTDELNIITGWKRVLTIVDNNKKLKLSDKKNSVIKIGSLYYPFRRVEKIIDILPYFGVFKMYERDINDLFLCLYIESLEDKSKILMMPVPNNDTDRLTILES